MATTEVGIRLTLQGGQVVSSTIDGVSTRLDKMGTSAKTAASGAETLRTALAGMATVGTVAAFVKMADAVTTLQTQLRLSSNTAQEATKAYGALQHLRIHRPRGP